MREVLLIALGRLSEEHIREAPFQNMEFVEDSGIETLLW
jgi:hypothetical protein